MKNKIGIFIVGLLINASVHAEAVLQLTTDLTSLNVNSCSVVEVDFYVKNNANKSLPIFFKNTYGQAISQLTSPVSSLPTCVDNLFLPANSSCVLRLQINAEFIESSFSLTPTVCYDLADGSTCSNPATNQRIAINLNDNLNSPIIAPFHFSLTKGGNTYPTLSYEINTFDQLQIILPSFYQSLIGEIFFDVCDPTVNSNCFLYLTSITNENVNVPDTAMAIIRGIDNQGNPTTADTTMTVWWDAVKIKLGNEQHLQYQSVLMDATSAYENVNMGGLTSYIDVPDYVVPCDSSVTNNCASDYETNCFNNNILPSCTAWFYAKSGYPSVTEDDMVDVNLIEQSNNQTISYNKPLGGEYITGLYAAVWPTNALASVYFNDLKGNGWSALSNSPQGNVNDIILFNGDLIAGGSFSQTGNGAVNNVAGWDGTTWYSLTDDDTAENGTMGVVNALSNIQDEVLLVGGNFSSVGNNVQANNIAVWCLDVLCEVNLWYALWDTNNLNYNGVNGPVNDITLFDNEIYVGGNFTQAGSVYANYIAYWEITEFFGGSWNPVVDSFNGNGTNGPVYSLSGDQSNGEMILYVGGDFSKAGINQANNIASWCPSSTSCGGVNAWSPLAGLNGDNGTNGNVLSVFYDTVDIHKVYVGGEFSDVSSTIPANNVAYWLNTQEWLPLSGYESGTNGQVNALEQVITSTNENIIYMGGSFNLAGAYNVQNVTCWNQTTDTWCNDTTLELETTVKSLLYAQSLVLYE